MKMSKNMQDIVVLNNESILAQDFLFKKANLNFEINLSSKLGIFSNKASLVSEFLQAISGISRSSKLFFKDKEIYDNEEFFKRRIFFDCKLDYFASLKPAVINSSIKTEFDKVLDEEHLSKLIKELHIRQECFVKDEVIFNPKGRTLMGLATLLSTNYFLIIDNTFVELEEELQKSFIDKFCNHKNGFALAITNLKLWEQKLDALIILGNLNNLVVIDPKLTEIYIHDKTDEFLEKRLFIDLKQNKELSLNFTKTERQALDRKKIKYKKLSIYEIEKYFE